MNEEKNVKIFWIDRSEQTMLYKNTLNSIDSFKFLIYSKKKTLEDYLKKEIYDKKISDASIYLIITGIVYNNNENKDYIENNKDIVKFLIYCGDHKKEINESLNQEKRIKLIEKWEKYATNSEFDVISFLTKYSQTCNICFKDLDGDESTFRKCKKEPNHFYHKECIKLWKILSKGSICPVCQDDYEIFFPS